MELVNTKVEWNFTMMESGMQCVMMHGITDNAAKVVCSQLRLPLHGEWGFNNKKTQLQ